VTFFSIKFFGVVALILGEVI